MTDKDVIVDATEWRTRLGIRPETATHVKIGILNAVPLATGGLERWLHRGDVLRLLASEAERLDSPNLRRLHDRIAEATAPKGQ